jgi:hypothetical protein
MTVGDFASELSAISARAGLPLPRGGAFIGPEVRRKEVLYDNFSKQKQEVQINSCLRNSPL